MSSAVNRVVVHVQEMPFKLIQIVVTDVLAFAAPNEQGRQCVDANGDFTHDVIQCFSQGGDVKTPSKSSVLQSVQPFHQEGDQDWIVAQGIIELRLNFFSR